MKVLVADDDMTSRLVLAATLRKLGHDVTAVVDGSAALHAWRSAEFPVVVSDWMMPGLDGPALCRAIREQARQHYTYVLLLTALGGKGNYLGGLDAGADDFITKPFDEEVLAARLRVAERIIDLHEALRRDATHDRLTSVWNRAAILDALELETQRSARESGAIGVLMVDLDHFKHINDSRGHAAGDAVLREAARRMKSAIRPYDRIGRYGGEEFVVVIGGGGAEQSLIVAERVRAAIGDAQFEAAGDFIDVTVSIGVSVSTSTRPGVSALLESADRALYCAKANGRNRVEFEAEPGGS